MIRRLSLALLFVAVTASAQSGVAQRVEQSFGVAAPGVVTETVTRYKYGSFSSHSRGLSTCSVVSIIVSPGGSSRSARTVCSVSPLTAGETEALIVGEIERLRLRRSDVGQAERNTGCLLLRFRLRRRGVCGSHTAGSGDAFFSGHGGILAPPGHPPAGRPASHAVDCGTVEGCAR